MLRILLVDDELQLLEITKAFLENLKDLEAEISLSAKEALEKTRTMRYDAIISDYQMPEMNGIGLLKEIRSRNDPTPFILFTGKGREEVVIEALNAGADFYLQKGGDPSAQFAELANMIEKAVQRRRMERDLIENEEKFENIFNSANDAIYILNPEGSILEINDVGCARLGYTKQEMLQRNVGEIDSEQYAKQVPERMKEVMERGFALFETEWVTKEGASIPSEVSARKINYAGGPAILGVARDVSERKRTEDILIENEIKFRTVADFTYDWEYWIEPGGRFIYCSPSCERISGYSSEEFCKDPLLLLEMVHPEDKPRMSKHLKTEMRDRPSEFDFRIITRKGEVRWISHACQAVFDDRGRYFGRRAGNRDITARRLAQEALRESERLLDCIVEDIPDMIFVKDAENLKFVRFNKAGEELLGYSRKELVGKSDYDIFPKDEADIFIERDRKTLRTKKLLDIPEESIHTRHKGERILHTKKIPILDEEGNPHYLLGISEDITLRKQAEDALRDRIMRYELVMDGSSAGLWDWDVLNERAYFSSQWKAMRGYAETEIGDSDAEWRSGIHPDDAPRVMAAMQAHFAGQTEVYEEEYRVRCKDGSFKWVLDRGKAVRDTSGQVFRMAGSEIDITMRKLVEGALRESEARFRELFNNIDSGIAVYEATSGGKDFIFKDFNVKAEKIEGVKKGDVIGKRITEVFPGADAMGMVEVLRSVWKTGRKEHLTNAEYKESKKASSWRENLVFKLPNGEVVAIYGDITEQKKVEDELRLTKNIFNDSIAAMGMSDANGIMTRVNEAFLQYLGYSSKEEVIGRSISDFMMDKNEQESIMKQLALNGNWQGDYQARRKDGSMILVHGLITTLKDENGKRIGYHSTAIDVTGQKTGQESSLSTNVKLNLLSNITVHDIQNQVIVLNGLVNKAKHANSQVQIKEYLSRMQQVADKIQSHVAFARDYQNLGKAPPTWIRLDNGIQDLASKFDSKWVLFDIALGSLEIFSDAMLNRAFYNLIDDTLKHGQKATKIKFTAKARGEDLILIYEDNGVGVPMDRKKNIFEKAPSTQKMHGLVLVKEILGITGMTIMENGEPGKGARFEIVVPKGNFRYSGTDKPKLN